ncbi:MAG: DUF1566 domain-containing protein [Candidatus Nitrohelix vancouverensis]|uniref:DUF1566 domain-containing protein n=1 Tax=Candidatus Nitrohelix vancouverensis TaxID=2705534 RepID=A0A7T0G4R9_9BACT|nr:MAG: DUF1566 domain-containing protein [Candidatus Nitrohelix vancouverensis]
MNSIERFIDNNDGTISDLESNLTWAKEDSWQAEQKWVTWDEAMEHAQNLSGIKFAGHKDWRLPTCDEAKTLFDPAWENTDKYDAKIGLNPIFPPGPLPTIWAHEAMIGNEGFILDLRNGEIRSLYKSKSGRMAARPVRETEKIIPLSER